MMRGLKFE
jgi:hypothetical protein